MNKLDMAHQYALRLPPALTHDELKTAVSLSWQYADLMQAEADKREPKGFPDVLQGDWQPDWGFAPDWAKWWSITKFGQGHWFLSEPKINKDSWVRETRECKQAPSFNYQGDWKQSLRKRPQ